jgi:proline racemase
VVDLTDKYCDVMVNYITVLNSQIYHTLDKHNNNYIIVLNSQIYHTLDEHNNHYITVLNSQIYHTLDKNNNHSHLECGRSESVKYCDVMVIVLV